MSWSIGRRDLAFAHSAASRALGWGHANRSRGETVAKQLTKTAVISAGTFGLGFVKGYAGAVDIAGAPIDLVAGFGLGLLALTGVGGAYSGAIEALSEAGFASYCHTLGAAVGDGVRRKSGKPIKHMATSSGNVMVAGDRRPLTDNEIAAFSMAARS